MLSVVVALIIYSYMSTTKEEQNYYQEPQYYPVSSDYTPPPPMQVNGVINEAQCGTVSIIPLDMIIKGTLAYPGKWPWAVYIESNQSFSGGTLITNQHVLTCAHSKVARGSKVTLGNFNRAFTEDSTVVRTAFKVFPHEQYSNTYDNDICVILLDFPVTFTDYIKPICLVTSETNLENVGATVVGWGKTETDTLSKPLLETTVYQQSTCPYQIDPTRQLCFGAPQTGSGVCLGDSGGPLMLTENNKWTQIGLVSYGESTCDTGQSAVYTKIFSYISWITSKLKLV